VGHSIEPLHVTSGCQTSRRSRKLNIPVLLARIDGVGSWIGRLAPSLKSKIQDRGKVRDLMMSWWMSFLAILRLDLENDILSEVGCKGEDVVRSL
jgi:hypothetical protein